MGVVCGAAAHIQTTSAFLRTSPSSRTTAGPYCALWVPAGAGGGGGVDPTFCNIRRLHVQPFACHHMQSNVCDGSAALCNTDDAAGTPLTSPPARVRRSAARSQAAAPCYAQSH